MSVRTRSMTSGDVDASMPSRVPEFLESFDFPPTFTQACVQLGVECREDLLLLQESDFLSCSPSISVIQIRKALKRIQVELSSVEEDHDVVDAESVVCHSPASRTSPASASWVSALPKWSEKSTPRSHLQAFETIMQATTIPQSQWPNAFAVTLPYLKQTFILSLLPTAWDSVRQAFLRRYVNPKDQGNSLRRLLCNRMKPGETPQEYGDRHLELCQRAERLADDPVILAAFEEGIPQRFRSFYALSPNPQNLEAAIALLVSVCHAVRADDGNTLSRRPVLVCRYCKKPGHAISECKKLAMKSNNGSQSSTGQRQQSRPKAPSATIMTSHSGQPSSTSSQITCFRCHKPGHYANRCPEKLSKNAETFRSSSRGSGSQAAHPTSSPTVSSLATIQAHQRQRATANGSHSDDPSVNHLSSIDSSSSLQSQCSPVDLFQEYQEACKSIDDPQLHALSQPSCPISGSAHDSVSGPSSNLLFVPLRLGDNDLAVTALVDSGASQSLLSSRVASQLSLRVKTQEQRSFAFANGSDCKADLAETPI